MPAGRRECGRVHEPRPLRIRHVRAAGAPRRPRGARGRARCRDDHRRADRGSLFIAAGARFIVGPSFSDDVARLCNRRRIVYIPGCGSATEIATAEELGCEIVKLFPAAAFDGPAFIRGLLGPSPGSKVMPTNVEASEASVRRWFEAGAACLGVAASLLPAALIAACDPSEVAARTRQLLGWVADARGRSAAGH